MQHRIGFFVRIAVKMPAMNLIGVCKAVRYWRAALKEPLCWSNHQREKRGFEKRYVHGNGEDNGRSYKKDETENKRVIKGRGTDR